MRNSNHVSFTNSGKSIVLDSPTIMPNASGYLWNRHMMINMNCRGYAISQFMQPEPAKYSYAPNMEAKTFMQPEHAYFSHHPGRFFYIKDEDTGKTFSVPYEPMRCKLDKFNFITNQHNIEWVVKHLDFEVTISLTLTIDRAIELWSFSVNNLSTKSRNLSFYPYFSIGYMSWLNQSATYNDDMNAIVATCITPYQKLDDYSRQKHYKDKTFLIADCKPTSWTASQKGFEGEGGLHNPSAVNSIELAKQDAIYETPVAVFQYRLSLSPKQISSVNFVFGAAETNEEINDIKESMFGDDSQKANSNTIFTQHKNLYQAYIESGNSSIVIESPDESFNHVVNHWLPRQMFYHGDVNRLSTDPQTRNYLQDNMGMCFIDPTVARGSFIQSLSQQHTSGVMPDGILLHPEAKLKYINQIPHADHSVWLPICLSVYLSETNDKTLLNLELPFSNCKERQTVIAHIDLAMEALIKERDYRGLSYIQQGDWCDPMNMVGHKGKGVSTWLSLATAFCLNEWCSILEMYTEGNKDKISYYRNIAEQINHSVNVHLWDGKWYGRGITDDNVVFGIQKDSEGKIYLNPQSWSMLSGAISDQNRNSLINQVSKHLSTPYGVMMLAPSYTSMREDIGRLTQKHPGVSENGAVYNHAAVFYAYSLYSVNKSDEAFEVLYQMLSINEEQFEIRGQLPNFIPNYYRGAYYQHPEQAGKSSQLFNTGTVAWYQRCIVEGLCGLKGVAGDLEVNPQLPTYWNTLNVKRDYLGAQFKVKISRSAVDKTVVYQDGNIVLSNVITDIIRGATYHLDVKVPY